MANKRALSWSAALRDLKDDRARRRDVREERLRTTAGLRGTPALVLSAWRGRSGRRYVVGIHELAEPELDDMGEAVVLAVRRDATGIGELVSVASAGQSPRERLHSNWIARARHKGATEMHVHRLAEDEAEREAIVADLGADQKADAAH
ncbi:hypothetical protein [Methylobacterium sp.]|jgi:hypothetical protein|uniref:hypothetical protein n=1 Tax=Methylobacterium sp. TaxID=409 RepID=UPI002601A6D8|nr:hypothetical protein [Methylobacterium sp.]MDB5644840.1 hypothetical protein [Methylobacterium sp.]